MTQLSAIADPILWGLAPLSIVLFVFAAIRPNTIVRLLACASLALATALLASALALPVLLPAGSAVVRPDGSSGDPRVLSALLVGIAALAAFMQGLRALRIPTLAQVGFWLPGLIVGTLVGVAFYVAGLHSSVALAGLFLGGLVLGTAGVMTARQQGDRGQMSVALMAASTALVVIAAMLSLHGARAERLQIVEGASLDTLGTRVTFVATQAPHDSLRRMQFAIGSRHGVDTVWAELRGRAGASMRSLPAGRAGSGPMLLPMALDERRTNPHEVTWIKKGETLTAGAAQVKFEKFRFVMGDTIRLYADLEVTHAGRVQRVSPGAIANAKGEISFSDIVEGYGPIAIAGVDADNGRVGLVLPTTSSSGVARSALIDLRLRPALPLAWTGAALCLLAFFFVLSPTAAERPSKSEA